MAIIRDFKGPPFDLREIWRNLHFWGKIKGGAFEISNYRNFSNKEKHEKSRNLRNRDFATIPQSHNPRVFSPGAPAENLGGGRLIPRIRGEIKGRAAGETLLRKMIDCNEEFMQWKAPFLSRRSAPPQPSYDVVTFPVWKRGFGMNHPS